MSIGAEIIQEGAVIEREAATLLEQVADAAFESIVYGSAVTGSPGQPVLTGALRNSWVQRELSDSLIEIFTESPYALVVEHGHQKATNHGNHSIKKTIAGFPKLVEIELQKMEGHVIDAEEVMLALRARLEAVAEIPPPADRAWSSVDFTPPLDRVHIESDFGADTQELISFPAQFGVIQEEGLYVVRYYGITNQGEAKIRAVASAILATFPPGLGMTLASGRLYIRGDFGPHAEQIIAVGRSKSLCVITIPWRAYSNNLIPA